MLCLRVSRSSIRRSQYLSSHMHEIPICNSRLSSCSAALVPQLTSPTHPTTTSTRPSSSFSYTPPQQTPAATVKISSRSAQIARHFSGSTLNTSGSGTNIPTTDTNMASKYSVRKIGAPNTLEHRIYIEKDGVPVSSFHDIPLYANEQQTILNMVVEIPRWTNGKMEVSRVLFARWQA